MARPTSNQQLLNKLGDRLREIRESKKWTLEETEEHGWPSWRHLQRIETGHKNVTIITLTKLAKLYGVKLSELLKGL